MKRSQDLHPDREDVLLREIGKSLSPDGERFQKNLLTRMENERVFPAYEQKSEWFGTKPFLLRYAYAAVFLAFFATVGLYEYFSAEQPIATIAVAIGNPATSSAPSDNSLYAEGTVQNNSESQASVLLTDLSLIRLDKQSSLKLLRSRKIQLLKGRLFANVEKTPTRDRFEIDVHDVSVVVLGTAFEVDAQKNQTVVTVYEGTVRVDWNDESRTLEKGDSLAISARDQITKTNTVTGNVPNWVKKLQLAESTSPILQAMQKHFPSRSYNSPTDKK